MSLWVLQDNPDNMARASSRSERKTFGEQLSSLVSFAKTIYTIFAGGAATTGTLSSYVLAPSLQVRQVILFWTPIWSIVGFLIAYSLSGGGKSRVSNWEWIAAFTACPALIGFSFWLQAFLLRFEWATGDYYSLSLHLIAWPYAWGWGALVMGLMLLRR
jgi:hypothetical protein